MQYVEGSVPYPRYPKPFSPLTSRKTHRESAASAQQTGVEGFPQNPPTSRSQDCNSRAILRRPDFPINRRLGHSNVRIPWKQNSLQITTRGATSSTHSRRPRVGVFLADGMPGCGRNLQRRAGRSTRLRVLLVIFGVCFSLSRGGFHVSEIDCCFW